MQREKESKLHWILSFLVASYGKDSALAHRSGTKQWTVAKWVEAIVPWMHWTLLVSIASDLWSPCIPDGSFPSLMCFQPTWKGQVSSAVCAPGRFSWGNSAEVAGSGFSWMFWTHPRLSFWVNESGRAAHVRNDDYSCKKEVPELATGNADDWALPWHVLCQGLEAWKGVSSTVLILLGQKQRWLVQGQQWSRV